MVLPLLFPQSNDARQPTSMEAIGYQRVQHALPDGRPDLAAKDNYYVRTKTTWYLAVDSDALPVDAVGNHHIVLPEHKTNEYELYEEKGRARGKLAEMFKQVTVHDKKDKPVKQGWGSTGAQEFDRPKCDRMMVWWVRCVTEEVETHTEGRHHATRTLKRSHWGVSTQGWPTGKPYIPSTDPWATYEAGKHVQVDPPTFGYGAVVLPKDDEF